MDNSFVGNVRGCSRMYCIQFHHGIHYGLHCKYYLQKSIVKSGSIYSTKMANRSRWNSQRSVIGNGSIDFWIHFCNSSIPVETHCKQLFIVQKIHMERSDGSCNVNVIDRSWISPCYFTYGRSFFTCWHVVDGVSIIVSKVRSISTGLLDRLEQWSVNVSKIAVVSVNMKSRFLEAVLLL